MWEWEPMPRKGVTGHDEWVITEALATALIALEQLPQSRLRKSEQGDKWSFCLTAGKIGPRIRRDDEQTSTPEPHPGFQGEGSACRRQGRPNTGSTGGAVRRPPQSDHIVESAA